MEELNQGEMGPFKPPKQDEPQRPSLWGNQMVLGAVPTSPREQEGSGSARATDKLGQQKSRSQEPQEPLGSSRPSAHIPHDGELTTLQRASFTLRLL